MIDKKENWMNSRWRPMMGWSYMLTCVCDFIAFPIMWSLLQAFEKGTITLQWQPITLQGAGLYHVAMGAVLGITAFGRTKEKIAGAGINNFQISENMGTTYIPPIIQETPNQVAPTDNYNQQIHPTTNQVIIGLGGRKAPMPVEDPLL